MPDKTLRPWLPMQPTLLPTDIARWLPEKHLARFVVEIVDRLDLSAIERKYHVKDPRGVQPYDPRMMVALLLYAYAVGVFSSRRIERATYEDVAFRVLTGDQQPDHDTIAAFRRDHLTEIRALFVEVLRIAGRMGLVTFGSLGLDGVKVRANASKHHAMSYDRMKAEQARLQAEIDELLRHAEQTDTDEALRFGNGEIVDIPEELALRQKRKARIQEAIAALEEEARLVRAAELREQQERHEAAAADPERDERARKLSATLAGRRAEAAAVLVQPDASVDVERPDDNEGPDDDLPSHRVKHTRDGAPDEKAQRNFTDPDSRIMVRDGDHYVQAFNAQAVVTEDQIVVATGVGNQAPDAEYLEPMLDRVNKNLEAAEIEKPATVPALADAGYFSEENVAVAENLGFDPHIAPGRLRHRRWAFGADADGNEATGPPPDATPKELMRAKLQTKEGAALYAKRKTMPEPVFGQILEARGFRRFLLRGLEKVRAEWELVATSHNILKMWRSGRPVPLAD